MKLLKTLLFTLLLTGGSYTFSQPTQLPIGSEEVMREYFNQTIDSFDVYLGWFTDDDQDNWHQYYHLGDKPGSTEEETVARVKALLKTVLDGTLAQFPNPEDVWFVTSYGGWKKGNLVFRKLDRSPFRATKDQDGKLVFPPEQYEVLWDINPKHYAPLDFPSVTRVRVAVQYNDGLLSTVYDSEEEWVKRYARVLVYPRDKYPYMTNLFHLRFDLAMSGKPGLITVTWQDKNGNEKVTLYNLSNGEMLTPLKVNMFPPPGEGPVLITAAVNPERDQVVETSQSLLNNSWILVEKISKKSIGETNLHHNVNEIYNFYRIRTVKVED